MERAKKKGTVLMTVVGVMMVLVVFLISTLVLTASSNRRSYYTYFETQAQYAAQAALDAVTNSAYSNNAFYNWVSTKVTKEAGPQAVTVDFADISGIQFTNNNKVVECTIERVDDDYIWDADTKAIHGQRAWKITATASVGRGRNQSDYTVVNYIYENYRPSSSVLDNSVANNANGSTYNYTYEGDSGSGRGGSKIGAMTRLCAASTNNNFACLGPNKSGMSLIPPGKGNYRNAADFDTTLNNNCVAVGDTVIVGNIYSNVELKTQFQQKGEGFMIWGDWNGGNANCTYWYANLNAKNAPTSYKDVNYVYVDGTLRPGQTNFFIGFDSANNTCLTAYPVNVYAGSIDTATGGQNSKTVAVMGDTFLYDTQMDSVWRGFGGSNIAAFIDNNINGNNAYLREQKISGNIFCNNKSLEIIGDQPFRVDGDLVFTNPSGTLKLSGNVTVSGKIICAGTYDPGTANVTCTGGVFVGAAAEAYRDASYTTGYHSAVPKVTETREVTTLVGSGRLVYHGNQWVEGAFWLNPPEEGVTEAGQYTREYDASDYKTETVTTTTSFDYSLFPFAFRLDEMFNKYYRWDLKTTVSGAQAVANAKADNDVKESIACGHNWENYGTFTANDNTVWYVPYTFPINETDSNKTSFLTAYEPVATSNAVNVIVGESKFDIHSVEGFKALKTGSTFPDFDSDAYTSTANGGSKTVTELYAVYHNASGEEVNAPITKRSTDGNIYVVTEDCTIDLSKHSNDVIFIDPGDHVDGNPLCIIFEGNMISNCNTTVLINNTATYNKANYAAKPTSYASQCKEDEEGTYHAVYGGRQEVYIFWKNGFGAKAQPFVMTTTGAYGGVSGSLQSCTFNVVSNPIYPKTKGSLSTVPAQFKYSYELVPNVVVFGDTKANYSFENASFINAEMITPTATVWQGNASLVKARVAYREESNCNDYVTTSYASDGLVPMFCLGSQLADVNSSTNIAMTVYIGDKNRGASSGLTRTSTDRNSSSNDLGQTYKDYFSNDHQGAH